MESSYGNNHVGTQSTSGKIGLLNSQFDKEQKGKEIAGKEHLSSLLNVSANQCVGSTRRMLSVKCSEHAARSHLRWSLTLQLDSTASRHVTLLYLVSEDSFKVIDYDKNSVSLLI